MKSQNNDIHFFKFLYSWIIVIYHMASSTAIACDGGYCGVEYFLLTAGMFLFMSFDKGEKRGNNITPFQYLKKRFMRFLPWSLTAFVMTAFVQRILIDKTTSLVALSDHFSADIWEILMINMNGMNGNRLLLNGPAWTLGSMLIIGFFIWTLMYYYKNLFLRFIMPLTLVVGYGYWMHLPSANTEGWIGFTNFGTFRTYLVFCLGYYCYLFGKKLAQINFTKAGKYCLSVIEVLIHIYSLAIIFNRAQRPYQWLITLMFFVAIAIAMSGHSYLAGFLGRFKWMKLLGDLSMSIYLVHTLVKSVFREVFDISTWGYIELLPLFVTVLIISLIHYYGTDGIVKLTSKITSKCKKVLIAE